MLERVVSGVLALAALILAVSLPAREVEPGYPAPGEATSTATRTIMPVSGLTSTPALFDNTYPNCDAWIDDGSLIRCISTPTPEHPYP